MKSLRDISDNITEEEYRNDGKLHYSTLATYARGGFNSLATLFDRKESPSLLFGSCCDTMLTDGMDAYNDTYIVAEIPELPDTIIKIVTECFNEFSITHTTLESIPDIEIIGRASKYNYQNNWKPETRAKVIKEKGSDYYRLLYVAEDKTIISNALHNEVLATVHALKTSPATSWYFEDDNPFDNSIERLYQLKFHSTFDGLDYSCMADLIIVDHTNKVIYPVDLKTSHKPEYDFFKSFIEWSYAIQARSYFRILEDNVRKDPYFKDFEIKDYRFIVANKNTLNPLVWEFPDTKKYGTLYYGKDNQIECKDPFDLGKELTDYLNTNPIVPNGISLTEPNNLNEWLKTL